MLRYAFILLFFISCASAPPKGISKITSDGVTDRTGLTLPNGKDAYQGKTNLPPGINLDTKLTAADAAAIALWNNPQYGVDLSQLDISRGDLIDAGQLRNPRVDILSPMGHKPFELLLNLPLEALWERPARVEAAKKAYEQLAYNLIQNGLNTIQEANIAHANLALAYKREAVLSKAVDLRVRISKINMNQRVRDGELTEAEGISTEVDSASSQELYVRAKHDTYLAKERFKLALGLVFESSDIEISTINSLKPVEMSAAEYEEQAFVRRPDLKALELSIFAAAKRADWEKARIAQLSFLLSSKGIGTYGVLTGPGFSAEIPIFHQNNGKRARADAEVEQSTRQYLALKQKIAFEVREARELLIQAREVLDRTQTKVLPLLEKTVRIAETQYRHKAASYLFVLEQTRSLVDAQLRIAEFEAAVVRAQAQLQRATGGSL